MPDFKDLVLPKLAMPDPRLMDGKNDILLPNYNGFGLTNLPSTISMWLGGPRLESPALDPVILSYFKPRYKRVILLLVDALGYNYLARLMAAGKANFWRDNLPKGLLFPITSVSPSTTASALTTIWTGAAPSSHGIIGYEMWVPELSMVINTILHTPTTFVGDAGGLTRAGFVPNAFMGLETFGRRLLTKGIRSHAFLPSSIGNSGLSQMHLDGSQLHTYTAESDLWANMRDILNERPDVPRFVYGYWSHVDSLMHRYGTNDERVEEQFALFTHGLQKILLEGMADWAREDTLLLLTADHGSIPTPADENYNLRAHPGLTRLLVMQPTCENRLPFLYIKPGAENAVRDYFANTWPGKFTLITRDEALALHLFGTWDPHPDLLNRIGDLVVINHDDAYLWWAHKTNMLMGRHGGFHPDEMLVPLYSVSLG